MKPIDIQEKNIKHGLFQFLFPFSFKSKIEQELPAFLKSHEFKPFHLGVLEDEDTFYGEFKVSHRDMEAYFLSFTNKVLFPQSEHQKGIKRYSKTLNLHAHLKTDLISIPFLIPSIDVILCPFELGFITIRTQLDTTGEIPLSHALEFAARFRVLEPVNDRDEKTEIHYGAKESMQIEPFVFNDLFKGLTDFFEESHFKEVYFETFPFFEDERMYVQSLISLKENDKLDLADVYRSGSLCGITSEGDPYISAYNAEYIHDYLHKNAYMRWAPFTYFVLEEHLFSCITNEEESKVFNLSSQFYGEFYYGLLLNLFHKIVLLKFGHRYAELNIQKDMKEMEKLIYSINSFTANYFSLELVSQSPSREIFFQLRKKLNIEMLYKEAKRTLNSLFKYQENVNSKKDSLLLLILTLYSVVGQMFGMGLVTSDFIGRIKWSHMLRYNPVEYFALFVAATGIVISIILGVQSLYQWLLDKKNQRQWVKQTVLSASKEENND